MRGCVRDGRLAAAAGPSRHHYNRLRPRGQVQPAPGAPTVQPAAFLEAPRRNGVPADRPIAEPPRAPSGQRGGDVVARRAVPAVSKAAWRRQWRRLTAMPLLDVPRMTHPRVMQRRGGAGLPPPPLAELARWGAGELSRLGSHGTLGVSHVGVAGGTAAPPHGARRALRACGPRTPSEQQHAHHRRDGRAGVATLL